MAEQGCWGPDTKLEFIAVWYDDASSCFTAPSGFSAASRIANRTNIVVTEPADKYDDSVVLILRGDDEPE